MESLEKRDLLNLAGDPFIKSILAPKGNKNTKLTALVRGYLPFVSNY